MRIPERRRTLSSGLDVGRLLPYAKRRMVGPFIFLDHMGPVQLTPPQTPQVDVLPHPHVGLSTLTYLYAGEIVHRDSLGSHVAIEPGAVNWMTAGRGITHSERFEAARRAPVALHGVQAWVALPSEVEEVPPSFTHHPAPSLPSWDEAGVRGRLLAGSLHGLQAPVQTYSPLHYAHLEMAPGSEARLADARVERAVYVARGEVAIDGVALPAGQLLVVGGAAERVTAVRDATVMLLGGEALGERHIYWNFVSSRRERLDEAARAWREGAMPLPPDDAHERVLLPPVAAAPMPAPQVL